MYSIVKKNSLLALIAILGFSLQSTAQMTLKVPKWEKFVQITKDGVNLRQAPNTSSPKLLSRGADWDQELSWTPKKEFEPHRIAVGRVLPVIKETREWYCLYYGDYCYGDFRGAYEVYVMKKFCKPVSPICFSDEDYQRCEVNRVNGSKEYLMGVYFLGSPSRAPWCRIGHQIGKYIVMADYDGYNSGMAFVKEFCTGESIMDIEYHPDRVKDTDIEGHIKSKQVPHVFDIWIKFTSSEEYIGPQKFVFDASTYKYPIDTYESTPIVIKKFVISASGKELQMQESPTLNAPKLVFVQDEDQNLFMVGDMRWENPAWNPQKMYQAKSRVFAVIGETDEWYQVYDSYNYAELYSAVGYIRKQDVKDATLMPFTESILCDKEFNIRNESVNTRVLSITPTNKFVISWGCPRVGICVSSFVNIGRIVNNTVFMCGNQCFGYNEERNLVEIGHSSFNGNRLVTQKDGYPDVDFTKLTINDAQKLQRENDQGDYPFAYVNIDNCEMHIFELRRFYLSEVKWPDN